MAAGRRCCSFWPRICPEPAWTLAGTVNNAPVTVRALAYIMIGHVAHHLDMLRDRYR